MSWPLACIQDIPIGSHGHWTLLMQASCWTSMPPEQFFWDKQTDQIEIKKSVDFDL